MKSALCPYEHSPKSTGPPPQTTRSRISALKIMVAGCDTTITPARHARPARSQEVTNPLSS